MVVYRNIQNTRRPTTASLTLVIKVGTSSICDEVTHYPLLGNLSRIVETIIQLKRLGHRVVLVTSAAVGTGLRRLNMSEKPKKLASIQVKHVSIHSKTIAKHIIPTMLNHFIMNNRLLQQLVKVV
jgi:glutamate 5-kinase